LDHTFTTALRLLYIFVDLLGGSLSNT